MPRIHEMIDSKFLKKEDAGTGILVTIKGVEKRDVGTEAEPEQKWVLLLEEQKPLVLNSTNLALIEKALGSDSSDDWTGQKIVLFNDENVSFGGKLTGGVRVDVNRTKRFHEKAGTAKTAAPAPPRGAGKHFDDFADDIPFQAMDQDVDRTIPQNAKFHAMVRDIANQMAWGGSRWSEEDWKRLFLGAKFGQPIVPNPFTHGICVMNAKRSRDLTAEQMAELIGEVEAFGNTHEVQWSEDDY